MLPSVTIFAIFEILSSFVMKTAFEGDTLTFEAARIYEEKTLGLYHVTIFERNKKIAVFSGLAFKTWRKLES